MVSFLMVEQHSPIISSSQRISLPVAVTSPGTSSELNPAIAADSISERYF